ncbi:MAG: hypothetical protein F4Z18_11320 [Caldilineaceae bacterium SB0666_bin_21]|nr:hypothetical protein [Caldilineaceae bacterium SB0666_bin_21]
MLLEPLTDALILVHNRINNFERDFANNESQTRLSLVDPVLKALGWNPQDPTIVRVEYPVRQRNRSAQAKVDYALLDSMQTPLAFVEAKSLKTDLGSAQDQLFEYAVGKSVPYAIATNGADWTVFKKENKETGVSIDVLLKVSIPDRSPTLAAIKLLSLWRGLLTSQSSIDRIALALNELEAHPLEPATASILNTQTATEDRRRPTPKRASPNPSMNKTKGVHSVETFTLSNQPNVQGRKPTRLMLPSGSSKQIGSWKSLLEEIVTWLYDTNQLTVDIPWPPNRTRKILQNTKILQKDGTEYKQQIPIKPGLFLLLHLGAVEICKSTAQLLADCGIDSSEVNVTLAPLEQ